MDLGNLLYDRHQSATEIERRLIQKLSDSTALDLGELTTVMLDLHPERANWVALLNRLWQAASRGGDAAVRRELALRAEELAAGGLEVAEKVLEALGPRRVVLTLSNYPSVIAALAAGAGRRRLIIGESRPLREGVVAARDLAAVGVDVTVVTDGALLGLPLTAAELAAPLDFTTADAVVLLGADALLAEGFVTKSGSRALVEVAGLAGLDVVVAAGADRLLPTVLATRLVLEAADPVDLGAPAAVHPVHQPCELVPWRLVTSVVVGDEILGPAALAPRLAALPVALELQARWIARF